MKMNTSAKFRRRRSGRFAFLEIDLMVGLAIFALALMPVGYSFLRERQVLRAEYVHGAAMEIVDGEMEILAAGEWKTLPDGPQAYAVDSNAAARLPRGNFQFTKSGKHLRLEWSPAGRHLGIAPVVREITVK